MSTVINHALRQLRAGKLAIGLGVRNARTVDIAQIAKTAGFDWLFIDCEHSSMDLDMAAQISAASLAVGVSPMVRVAGFEHWHASRILDNGAQGIVFPHVDDAATAKRVADACRFPPVGKRSMGGGLQQTGFASMPDSLELKVQSGIAPGWLAFGSVKWTDWSQLQVLEFCPATVSALTPCTSLDLLYRDGWTITGGIGHKFNDQWSGALSLTWDRGTSTGVGAQTDTWTVGAGLSYAPTQNVELRFAGAVGILTSGKSGSKTYRGEEYGTDVSYSFDNDFVGAVSTSLKVRF